ncbi:putative oxidoreductase ydgJ [Chitinispirillum alkaliphilum]|nr:putative oxidoreductase ydgJ [Chitinispirillum alkaliphilum]
MKEINSVAVEKLNLAFVGLGWIGRNRMEALLESGVAKAAYLVDCDESMVCDIIKDAQICSSLEQIVPHNIDGVVIATPSAMHAEQSIYAMESGCAVFCQKPLARTALECKQVIETSKRNNKLLGVDFSYRFLKSVQIVREIVESGELGEIYSADCVFHNAYGPDKAWFYDKKLSGGGCVMDLGVHLIDLILWLLKFPKVHSVSSTLFCKGENLPPQSLKIEDYANFSIELESGTVARFTCSWGLHAGKNALIEITLYGTEGALSIKNVNGSFYDFRLERYSQTSTQVLCEPPDNWGPGAIMDWAERLSAGQGFDTKSDQYLRVSEVIDKIYGR